MERESSNLKEENDNWKSKYEELQFKVKVLLEKEKIHEQSFNNFKELQKNYENSISDMRKEYKNKELILLQKINEIEKETNNYINNLENDYKVKSDSCLNKLKESERINERVIF